jgi:hypothetical protein
MLTLVFGFGLYSYTEKRKRKNVQRYVTPLLYPENSISLTRLLPESLGHTQGDFYLADLLSDSALAPIDFIRCSSMILVLCSR